MADRKKAATLDPATVAGQAAALLLERRYAAVCDVMPAVQALEDPEAVAAIGEAVASLRDAIRVFGPLYPAAQQRAWARRTRSVARAAAPLERVDRSLAALRPIVRKLDEPGKRAAAFVLGFLVSEREWTADVTGYSLESVDPAGRATSFRTFAQAPKKAGAAKLTMREFAAPVISGACARVYASVPAMLEDASPENVARAGKAARRFAGALGALEPALEPGSARTLEARAAALSRSIVAFDDLQSLAVELADPDLAARATVAGVTPAQLGRLADAVGARAVEAAGAVARAFGRMPQAKMTALLGDALAERAAESPEPAPEIEPSAAPEPASESAPEGPAVEAEPTPEPAIPAEPDAAAEPELAAVPAASVQADAPARRKRARKQ